MSRILFYLFLFISFTSSSQIKSPAEFLGYEIGTEFTRHADVVNYFEYVAANSSMGKYDTYGKTTGRRPLTYAIVSSSENIKNIETIRIDNLKNMFILQGKVLRIKPLIVIAERYHTH